MTMAQNWRQKRSKVMSVLEFRSETKYYLKRTFKNEQLAAHKQSSEQTRQIFSKIFAWINERKKKKKGGGDGHNFTLSHFSTQILSHGHM